MDRDEARQAIRGSWRQIITGITKPAKQKVNHEQSYICPFCGHGTHGDGLTLNPRSADKNGLKCFSCDFSGDIIDLYKRHTGADYNTALSLLAQEIGITIDPYQKATEGSRRDYKAAADKINARTEEARQKAAEQAAEGTADYTAYYRQCEGRLTDPAAKDYLQGRGISLKTAQACEVGFDPAADPANAPGATGDEYKPHPCPRIIFPTDQAHYVARSIDPNTPKQYQKMNPNREKGAGSAGLFNRKAIYNYHAEPVFIVEGAFDALAVVEAGGQAVALNSAANAGTFINSVKEIPPEQGTVFILCLDNDEAGQGAAATIREGLQRLQLPFIGWNISGDHKDPNEALTADRAAFITRVKAAQEGAREASATLQSDQDGKGDNLTGSTAEGAAEGAQGANDGGSEPAQITADEWNANNYYAAVITADPGKAEYKKTITARGYEEYIKAREGLHAEKYRVIEQNFLTEADTKPDNVQRYIDSLMAADIEKFKQAIPTGYSNLDRVITGLNEGLYCIAAISSLGKTTFAAQMADQIATGGQDVIFFSLEMSRLEMVSKSLARITAQDDLNKAVTSLAIRRGYLPGQVLKAAETYKGKTGNRLSIVEGNFSCDVYTIRDYVKQYINESGARPVVFIDYLQIITPVAMNGRAQGAKEAVDFTITELKRLSRDLHITIIVISSLNRANYLTPVSFESLKESGAIEYSADCIFGLQFSCLEDDIFDKEGKLKEKRERINNAKAETPRKIQLTCLKNRYGLATFTCDFEYYPANDLFIPAQDFQKAADEPAGRSGRKATRI